MSLTKIGPKFQVTIPKTTRDALGLSVGDLMDASPTKDGILLRPQVVMHKFAFAALQKQAKKSGKHKLSEQEIAAEIAAVRKAKTKRPA
jgi:AbrB family looped-hinge helix DNA binding protein